MDYLSEAITTVMSAVEGAFSLLDRIPQRWLVLIIGIVFFCYFSRLIIAPLFGATFHSGTDSARKVDNEE